MERKEKFNYWNVLPVATIIFIMIAAYFEGKNNRNNFVWTVEGVEHYKCNETKHSLFNESFSLECSDGFRCVNCSFYKKKKQ